MGVKIEKAYPPAKLLQKINYVSVPYCKDEKCVAYFITQQDATIKSCSSRIDTLRGWSNQGK